MGDLITRIDATEILGARANALEVIVTTESGATGRATPEPGVSTGSHEARMVLDGGRRFGGLGVQEAARNVNRHLAPALLGMDVSRQREIDLAMVALDGTADKSRLGANAIVGISIAVAKAAAASAGLPLYQYLGGPNATVIPMPIPGVGGGGGGRYRDPGSSRWFKPSYQYMPYGAGSYARAMEMNYDIQRELGRLMTKRYGNTVRTYSGLHVAGLLENDEELLEAMTEAIIQAGYEGEVGLYFDAAADCYYERDTERYVGLFSAGEQTRDQLIARYVRMVERFPLVSIEDPLHEDDFEGHAMVTAETGIEIVGDDLFTTNIERLEQAIPLGAANSMVLKITQVGTVSEALDACDLALRSGYNVHPCGSRGDVDSIADFAVALNAGQLRAGDWNRPLAIERELGAAARWPGRGYLKGWRNRQPPAILSL
jgi:enolase